MSYFQEKPELQSEISRCNGWKRGCRVDSDYLGTLPGRWEAMAELVVAVPGSVLTGVRVAFSISRLVNNSVFLQPVCGIGTCRHFRRLQVVENEASRKLYFRRSGVKKSMDALFHHPVSDRKSGWASYKMRRLEQRPRADLSSVEHLLGRIA